MRIRWVAVGVVAFMLGSGSMVFALTSAGVTACVNNTTGIMRIERPSAPCLVSSKYPYLVETPMTLLDASAVAAEAAARDAADAILRAAIDDEASARAKGDAKAASDLASEAGVRQSADAGLQSSVDALGSKLSDLADETLAQPSVSSRHLTGYRVVTTTSAASVPASIPAGGSAEFVLLIPDISENDLFTVSTSPTTPLPAGLFVTGLDVDPLGGAVRVRAYNSTAAPMAPINIDWKVRWIDLG